MCLLQVRLDPCDDMVLERAFDKLVEEVGREKFMNVGTGEVICEWL